MIGQVYGLSEDMIDQGGVMYQPADLGNQRILNLARYPAIRPAGSPVIPGLHIVVREAGWRSNASEAIILPGDMQQEAFSRTLSGAQP